MDLHTQQLTDKIYQNLSNSEKYSTWDELTPQDEDYMMFSPKPVGYNTTSEQRYLMHNLLVGFNHHSILDIGCGRGDMHDVLQDLFPNSMYSYHGIDHNPVMIDLAKAKYGLDCKLGAFETTQLPITEWVVANGVFTQRRCETEDEDLQKLMEDIDILYKTATSILSFNLLNPINTTHHKGFLYVHPGLILDMLIEKYKDVVVRCNYSKDVYTVLIYKF